MSRVTNQSLLRRAVTLMEVIIAIGVILIGLLGLLSILPLAGRRAQESVSLSVGPVIGKQIISELQTRRFLAAGRLRPVRESTASPNPTNLTHPATPTVVSFCIDPMFASFNTPVAAAANGYSAAQFPYYKINHNPAGDPSTGSTNWPVPQPRLTRVGITRANSLVTLLNVNEALELSESSDDLAVTRPNDRTLNAQVISGINAVPVVDSGLEYGKRIPSGEYSWFATVNPLPGGQYANVSVVVQRKRARTFDTPTTTTAPDLPEENGIDERLAYVTYATGFSGGAGGTIHLVSNANTVDDIAADDWVLLSRFIRTSAGPPSTATGDYYHRWYRVVGVNGEAERFVVDGDPMTDDTNLGARFPNGTSGQSVWRHKVTLDGTDWAFEFRDSALTPPNDVRAYADDTFTDNTYATIVTGVVSVTERTVLLSDL